MGNQITNHNQPDATQTNMKTMRKLLLHLILPCALVVPELAIAAWPCPGCGLILETPNSKHVCDSGGAGGGGQKARQRQGEIDTIGTMQRELRKIELETQERFRRQNAEAEAIAARDRAPQNQRDDSPPRQREDFGSRGSDPGSRRSDPVDYSRDSDRGTERPAARAAASEPVAARPLFRESLSSFLTISSGPSRPSAPVGANDPAGAQPVASWRSTSLGSPQPASAASGWQSISLTPGQVTTARADDSSLSASDRQTLEKARAGDQFAQNTLGWMHEQGRGVARDPVQACLWYSRAATQGNEEARKAVKALEPQLSPAESAQFKNLLAR